jgi:hypothetical protein
MNESLFLSANKHEHKKIIKIHVNLWHRKRSSIINKISSPARTLSLLSFTKKIVNLNQFYILMPESLIKLPVVAHGAKER